MRGVAHVEGDYPGGLEDVNAPTPSPESARAELQAAIDAAAHRGTLTDPIPDAQFETAAVLLAWLRRSAGHLDVWPPLVAVSGEFVFELWHYPRKLTLYVESDGTVSVIRAWGDHADEMDEPPYDEATRDGLLRWLETGEAQG